jgi:hypothetical protein
MDGKTEESIQHLETSLQELVNNHESKKYDISNFIITKTLKALDKYKPDKKTGKVHLAHVMLAERVKERDPGNAFGSNDRVPYCFISVKGDEKKMLQGDMVETPSYIEENNLELNYLYYIQKQLELPIKQLFSHIDKERSTEIFDRIIKRNRREKFSKQYGMKKISMFLKEDEPKGIRITIPRRKPETKAPVKKVVKKVSVPVGSMFMDDDEFNAKVETPVFTEAVMKKMTMLKLKAHIVQYSLMIPGYKKLKKADLIASIMNY